MVGRDQLLLFAFLPNRELVAVEALSRRVAFQECNVGFDTATSGTQEPRPDFTRPCMSPLAVFQLLFPQRRPIPDHDRAVVADRCETPAVFTERECRDDHCMAGQR